MKDGKKILWVLLLGALGAALYLLRQPSPTPAPLASTAASARQSTPSLGLTIPDAVLHTERLQSPSQVKVDALRRNIFEYGRSPVQAPVRQTVQVTQAPPPPPPPIRPAPVRFFGFAEGGRGGRRVFLTDGEGIYVVAEGEVILRRYRLLRVRNESVEVEELQGNQRWVVPLEQP